MHWEKLNTLYCIYIYIVYIAINLKSGFEKMDSNGLQYFLGEIKNTLYTWNNHSKGGVILKVEEVDRWFAAVNGKKCFIRFLSVEQNVKPLKPSLICIAITVSFIGIHYSIYVPEMQVVTVEYILKNLAFSRQSYPEQHTEIIFSYIQSFLYSLIFTEAFLC